MVEETKLSSESEGRAGPRPRHETPATGCRGHCWIPWPHTCLGLQAEAGTLPPACRDLSLNWSHCLKNPSCCSWAHALIQCTGMHVTSALVTCTHHTYPHDLMQAGTSTHTDPPHPRRQAPDAIFTPALWKPLCSWEDHMGSSNALFPKRLQYYRQTGTWLMPSELHRCDGVPSRPLGRI